MKIIIETIPHLKQRYNTIGDWRWEYDILEGEILRVKVSELKIFNGADFEGRGFCEAVIGIHEVVEALQCRKDGVTEKQVDEFDNGPEVEEADDLGIELGDHWKAPYKMQHSLATGIERILCFTFGIPWYEYEDLLIKLTKHYDKVKEEENEEYE